MVDFIFVLSTFLFVYLSVLDKNQHGNVQGGALAVTFGNECREHINSTFDVTGQNKQKLAERGR